jgi:hypothetical protein
MRDITLNIIALDIIVPVDARRVGESVDSQLVQRFGSRRPWSTGPASPGRTKTPQRKPWSRVREFFRHSPHQYTRRRLHANFCIVCLRIRRESVSARRRHECQMCITASPPV